MLDWLTSGMARDSYPVRCPCVWTAGLAGMQPVVHMFNPLLKLTLDHQDEQKQQRTYAWTRKERSNR